MKTTWFLGATSKEDREAITSKIVASTGALDILKTVCYNMIKEADKTSHKDYDSPSWAFKQADQNGYIRALKEIVELINIDQT